MSVQGAGFPDTEWRNWSVSFLCFLYIKGTLLMHLSVSVTYLKLSSVCDPPESMAKVGPLRLLSVSIPNSIICHNISFDFFWRFCMEGSHLFTLWINLPGKKSLRAKQMYLFLELLTHLQNWTTPPLDAHLFVSATLIWWTNTYVLCSFCAALPLWPMFPRLYSYLIYNSYIMYIW